MSVNLLDMAKDQISGNLLGHAAKFLGESESNTSSALGSILPSLLGTLVDKGSSESGASGIMDMLKDSDSGLLDNIGGIFGKGSGAVNGLLNGGSGILSMLLGNKVGGIVDLIASVSGLKKSSSSSLLKMAAPFLMSMIGKYVKSNGLGISGLMDLLSGQKSHVASALPSGFGSALGLANFGDDTLLDKAGDLVSGAADKVGDAAESVVDGGKKVVSGAAEVVGDVGNAAVDTGKRVISGAADVAGDVGDAAVSTGGSILKWALPALIVLGLLSWFGVKTCAPLDKAGDMVKNTTETVAGGAVDLVKDGADVVGDAAGAVVDGVAGAFSSVNEAAKSALGKIKFAAGSAGSQMMDFIEGGFKGDGKFTFRNLRFNSGSAAITGATAAEVDNLAAILKAYEGVNVVVEGYTDSTGNAASNVTLSENRANAVKNRLVAAGINGDRIVTKGLGSANPVASNDTKEGQAQNRRIELRIVK